MLRREKRSNLSRYYGQLFILLALFTNAYASTEPYSFNDFKKLQKDHCKPPRQKLLQKLTGEWVGYKKFIKQCDLKKDEALPAAISIVSIWVTEYYESKPISDVASVENFPLPIIVYQDVETVGELPELYPENDVVSPKIYFGKWMENIPTEIRVDVSNPAVEGNYFYPPLLWNDKSRTYEMKSKDVTYGQRGKQ